MSAALKLELDQIKEFKQTFVNMNQVAELVDNEIKLLVPEEEANTRIEEYNLAARTLGKARENHANGTVTYSDEEWEEIQKASAVNRAIKDSLVDRLKEHIGEDFEDLNQADLAMHEVIKGLIEDMKFSQIDQVLQLILKFGVINPKVRNGRVTTSHGHRVPPTHPAKVELRNLLYQHGMQAANNEVQRCKDEISRLQESGQSIESAMNKLETANTMLIRMTSGALK